ncbi:MAG: hypothetical protein ACI4XM_03090 [Candidatus Coprovivens sp.]
MNYQLNEIKEENKVLKSEDEIVREILEGKWGNGEERKQRLEEARI